MDIKLGGGGGERLAFPLYTFLLCDHYLKGKLSIIWRPLTTRRWGLKWGSLDPNSSRLDTSGLFRSWCTMNLKNTKYKYKNT
jgi:hypothetical protein